MPDRLLTSPILTSLGIPHGFSIRAGGVSSGIFESLNFGNPSDLPRDQRDPYTNIRANIERLLSDLRCTGRETVEVHQVHSAHVHVVSPGQPAHPGEHDTKADAIITADPSRILMIRVADCAPILLADAEGPLVAAVHAGWRGVVSGVLPETIRRMRALGARNLAAAVGPCISVDHFEVGDEVVAEFHLAFPNADSLIRREPGAKAHIDLKQALATQLRAAGIVRFDILPHCTHGDASLFFSHRRDQGRTGRMVGLIGPRA